MAFSERLTNFNKVGKLFYINNTFSVPTSSVKYILFQTNESIANIEAIGITGNTGLSIVSLYADPIITSEGTPLVIHRYNRTIEPTEDSSNMKAFEDAVISIDGIVLLSSETFGVVDKKDIFLSTVSGGGEFEILLSKNKSIVIKLDNTDPDNIASFNINTQWLEENE